MFLLNLRTGIFMVRKFCLTSFSFCFIPSLTLITNMTVQELIPEFVFPQGVQLPFHSPVENVEHGSEDITSGNHGSPQNVTSRPHWTVCGWSTLPFFFFFSCYCCLNTSASHRRTMNVVIRNLPWAGPAFVQEEKLFMKNEYDDKFEI